MGILTINSARELSLRRLFLYEFDEQGPAIYLGGIHASTLPLAKLVCQAFLCRWEMDFGGKAFNPWTMPRSPRKGRVVRPPKGRLYIGEWIRALGEAPTAIATALKLNEGYLSQLINNRKQNPSFWTLCEIADELKIPVGYLRQPPPAVPTGEIDPTVLARLIKAKH